MSARWRKSGRLVGRVGYATKLAGLHPIGRPEPARESGEAGKADQRSHLRERLVAVAELPRGHIAASALEQLAERLALSRQAAMHGAAVNAQMLRHTVDITFPIWQQAEDKGRDGLARAGAVRRAAGLDIAGDLARHLRI